MNAQVDHQPASDPLWYKDAVIYEVHVRAFFDGNNDGIGDFAGLTRKLDYIQELGVNTIWLLPFYPSPGKDDGYDIADYHNIHPQYGTREDFKLFVAEAHHRGLRVITELVINHTLINIPGSRSPVVPRPDQPNATTTSGATHRTSTPRPGSSSAIPRFRTGHWTRWRRRTTGIAFSATSPI